MNKSCLHVFEISHFFILVGLKRTEKGETFFSQRNERHFYNQLLFKPKTGSTRQKRNRFFPLIGIVNKSRFQLPTKKFTDLFCDCFFHFTSFLWIQFFHFFSQCLPRKCLRRLGLINEECEDRQTDILQKKLKKCIFI